MINIYPQNRTTLLKVVKIGIIVFSAQLPIFDFTFSRH